MRDLRRARQAAAFAVVLLFSPLMIVLPSAAVPTPMAGSSVALSLWIHADDTLSMAGNGQEGAIPTSATTRAWQMADGFQKDVCIDGVDIGSGKQGFQVTLATAFVVPVAGTNITVRVKDDTFATIAEDNFAYAAGSFPRPTTNSVWNLNFTAARQPCGPNNVLRGHRLILEFASPATMGWGDYRNAHIAMKVTDPILPTGHTENAAGPATVFFPNDIDGSREVIFNGTLGNAFTDALISVVRVTVKDPSNNAVQNATGSVNLGNWTYTWDYPRSSPGSYSAAIQVEDTQGHTYNMTISFTFAGYGLRMNTQGAIAGAVTRYTTQGIAADYELTVTNVGGSATVALMLTESAPPTGWAGTFDRNNVALDPGASATVHFLAAPSPGLGPGNSAQITVVAIANTDPAPIKARDSLVTTTIIEREIFLDIEPPRTNATVKLGATARYDFTLTNNGGQPTDVVFNATAAPAGWARRLSGDLVAEGDGWRLVGLEAGGNRVITLEVVAPAQAANVTTFPCTVSARSVQNASAVATFTGTTTLLLGIELVQTSLPVEPTGVNPGGFVDFQFDVVNTDPIVFHPVNDSDIRVSEAPNNPQFVRGVDTGDIAIAPPINCCYPGANGTLSVVVSMPQKALAGRYQFTVFVSYDGDPGKFAQLNFSLVVRQVTAYALRIVGSPSTIVLVGGSTTVDAFIVSDGNYPVLVDLQPSVLRSDTPDDTWTVRVEGSDGGELGRARLEPFSQVPVKLTITAPKSAFNGDHRELGFKISRALSGLDPWNLAPTVGLDVSLDSGTVFTRMWQNSFLLIIFFVLLAAMSVSMARRALRGPRPPRPPPPPPAKKPSADQPKAGAAQVK